MSHEELQAERAKLDEEWAKLRKERSAFEAERSASGVETKLFVGNLDETSTEEEVRALFEPFGSFKEIVMLTDREGKSKRSCFVKYYTKSAAEAAVEGLNGKHTDKNSPNPVVVRYARDKQMLMQNMKPQQQFFQQQQQQPQFGGGYGAQGGYGGYGNGGYEQANPYMQGQQFGGARANGFGGGAPNGGGGGGGGVGTFARGPNGANLYVNNLSRQASESDVKTMFGDFGTVLSVKLFPMNGYGFVSFDNASSAQNAISCLNGLAVGDGSKRLEVSIKKDKGGGGGEGGATSGTGGAAGRRFAPY